MIVISWNCRGLDCPSTVHRIRQLCRDYASDFLFLQELKCNNLKQNKIMKYGPFDYFDCFNSLNASGGICLLWKRNFSVIVIDFTQNWIYTEVLTETILEVFLIGVYGPPKVHERHQL